MVLSPGTSGSMQIVFKISTHRGCYAGGDGGKEPSKQIQTLRYGFCNASERLSSAQPCKQKHGKVMKKKAGKC